MAQFAEHPTHAYLFTGPEGCGNEDAARAFAAALQCPDNGCGTCEICDRVWRGTFSDVTQLQRVGVSWSVEDVRDAEHVARRIPIEGTYQVVIIPNVERMEQSFAALLKILEEPPRRTVFILTGSELPDSLVTIESRCVVVPFRRLAIEDVAAVLVQEGVDVLQARVSAEASAGDLIRARVLATDEGLADRLRHWQEIPRFLTTTPPASLATDLLSALEMSLEPLKAVHADEAARFREEHANPVRRRAVSTKDLEDRQKRELRRYRTDELRFGLAALTRVYRESMVASLEKATDGAGSVASEAKSAIAAIDHIAGASRSLSSNVNEQLMLTSLLTTLTRL